MMDIEQTLADAESERLKEMEKRLADLYRASGLRESMERMEGEAATIENSIKGEEKALQQAESAKRAYEAEAGDKLASRTKEFLPSGELVVEFDEKGGARIFWSQGESKTPARSLSGGEKAVFIPALSAAWAGGEGSAIVSMEGGEADSQNLRAIIKNMAENCPEDVQFLVMSWHLPDGIDSDDIQIIRIGGEEE